MTDQHPITPPHKLKQQWLEQASRYSDGDVDREHWLIERADRRPKPPTQAEKALHHFELFSATFETSGGDSDLIRRALVRLKLLEDSND